MKKILSILVIAMLLAAPVASLAEIYTSEAIGIAFEVPEGMTVSEDEDPNTGLAQVRLTGEDVVLYISAGVVEALADIDLAAADEEQIERIITLLGFNADEGESPVAYVLYADGEVPMLEIFNLDKTGSVVVELDSGYVFIQGIVSITGEPLSDDDLAVFGSFSESITGIEEDEEAGEYEDAEEYEDEEEYEEEAEE